MCIRDRLMVVLENGLLLDGVLYAVLDLIRRLFRFEVHQTLSLIHISLMAFRSFFSLFSNSRLSFSSFEVSGKGSVLLSRYQHINCLLYTSRFNFLNALGRLHGVHGVF